MRSSRVLPLFLALVTAASLLAACGSDDEEAAAGADTGAETDAGDGEAAFPVTVEHKYGSTTIEAEPERVVSVGFTDQDFVLALGVTPVGIREWYGEHPFATWPWAQDELGDAEPEVLSSAELNFEAVASLRPDLIVGVSSGMTEEEYETLSAIAPTLTQSGDYVDYGTPWQAAHRSLGQALGKSDLAEEQITEVEGRFVELAGDLFYSSFSLEEFDRLDRDLLVWLGAEDEVADRIRNHPLHDTLEVVTQGREIFLSVEQGAAAGFSSPLSLPYFLDSFVPQLEAAMDDDPATEVPAA